MKWLERIGLKRAAILLIAAFGLAPLPAAAQAGTGLVMIEVREGGPDGCRFRAEGRRMSAEQLERRARTWSAQRRTVAIHGDRNLPYRCIGGVIFVMQSAGIEKVSFIGRPIGPSVDLYVAGKGCAIMRNGELVTIETVRAEAAEWHRKDVPVALALGSDVTNECFASVATVLTESGIRMGFVGNEQNVAR